MHTDLGLGLIRQVRAALPAHLGFFVVEHQVGNERVFRIALIGMHLGARLIKAIGPGGGKQFDDVKLAAVLTYIRNAWGNKTGDMVQPKVIKAFKNILNKN